METAAESRDPALCEELLRFFVEKRDKENFCAMSYTGRLEDQGLLRDLHHE